MNSPQQILQKYNIKTDGFYYSRNLNRFYIVVYKICPKTIKMTISYRGFEQEIRRKLQFNEHNGEYYFNFAHNEGMEIYLKDLYFNPTKRFYGERELIRQRNFRNEIQRHNEIRNIDNYQYYMNNFY